VKVQPFTQQERPDITRDDSVMVVRKKIIFSARQHIAYSGFNSISKFFSKIRQITLFISDEFVR